MTRRKKGRRCNDDDDDDIDDHENDNDDDHDNEDDDDNDDDENVGDDENDDEDDDDVRHSRTPDVIRQTKRKMVVMQPTCTFCHRKTKSSVAHRRKHISRLSPRNIMIVMKTC